MYELNKAQESILFDYYNQKNLSFKKLNSKNIYKIIEEKISKQELTEHKIPNKLLKSRITLFKLLLIFDINNMEEDISEIEEKANKDITNYKKLLIKMKEIVDLSETIETNESLEINLIKKRRIYKMLYDKLKNRNILWFI